MARDQVLGDGDRFAHASTQVSFEPPPCEEFTTSEPARSATRVRPPGSTQVSRPVTANGRRSMCRAFTPSSHSVGLTDSLHHRLADVVGRIGLEPVAELLQFGLAGVRADQQPVAAGLRHRLHHQFVQMIECIRQPVRLGADARIDIRQDRVLAQVVADDARHVGIHRLVVGDAGADRVGDRHRAAPPRLHQPAHAQLAVGTERVGIEEIVVQPPVDRVHRREPRRGAHPDRAVLDQQVLPLDQRHAHLARQEHVLEIGRVEDAGRQQHHLRIAHARPARSRSSRGAAAGRIRPRRAPAARPSGRTARAASCAGSRPRRRRRTACGHCPPAPGSGRCRRG